MKIMDYIIKNSFISLSCSLIISILLILPSLFPVYYSNGSLINGTGFGNSGLRFTSFAQCDGKYNFFKDSEIIFKTTDNNDSKKNITHGDWEIKFNQYYANISKMKAGNIINFKIDKNYFFIVGKETLDNICKNNNSIIIITGQCGKNNPIYFMSNDNERVGSIIPPRGDKMYHLFGDQIICK